MRRDGYFYLERAVRVYAILYEVIFYSLNMMRRKSPEELSNQLNRVSSGIEHSLIPPFADRNDILKKSARELADFYPTRYGLYSELLQNGDRIDLERKQEIQASLRLLNSLDYYIANHRTGDEQGRVLRPRQFSVFEDLRDFIEEGKLRGYVKLPTGVGKTVLFLELIKVMLQKTLIVVPTNQLVDQTIESIQKFAASLNTGRVDKAEKRFGEDVTVITYQSLVLGVKNGTLDPEQFKVVVLDEVHRGLGDETEKILNSPLFGHALMLGFTATPKFTEGKQVKEILSLEEIHSMNIQEAVEEGLLAGFRVILARTNIDLKKIKVSSSGDYDEGELDKAINTIIRNRAAVDLYKKAFMGEKFVAYCNSVSHAEHVAAEFQKQGIPVAAIHGNQSLDEQRSILQKLRDGELVGVTNAKILVEGWDEPSVKVCLNLRPTQSLVDAEQRGGRVLRLFNNRNATVVDFIDDSDVDRFPITFVEVANASVIPPDKIEGSKTQKNNNESSENIIDLSDIQIDNLDLLSDSGQILAFVKERTDLKYQFAPETWFSINDLGVLVSRRSQTVKTWIAAAIQIKKIKDVGMVYKKYRNPRTESLEWFVDSDIAEAAIEYGKQVERDYLIKFVRPPHEWISLRDLEKTVGNSVRPLYKQFRNQFMDQFGFFGTSSKDQLLYISKEFADYVKRFVSSGRTLQELNAERAQIRSNERAKTMQQQHEDYLSALPSVIANTFGTSSTVNNLALDKVQRELASGLITVVQINDKNTISIGSATLRGTKNRAIIIRKERARVLNRDKYKNASEEAGPDIRLDPRSFTEEQDVLVVVRG